MRCFNQVLLIGRLVGDPEQKLFANNTKMMSSFFLAVQRDWYVHDSEKEVPTDFFRVVAWGKFSEFCQRVLKKGMMIFAMGHILNHSYEGKNGRQYVSEVTLSNVHILRWPKGIKSILADLPNGEIPPISAEMLNATIESCN